MNKERPYDISPEPLWCEDCKHFCNADMGGEGECDIDNHDTWYGCPICEKAELKSGEVKKNTNYDRIRNMGIEELARFLEAIQENALFNNKIMWENEWEKVLESEVEGE
jgi:hypothetical protein